MISTEYTPFNQWTPFLKCKSVSNIVFKFFGATPHPPTSPSLLSPRNQPSRWKWGGNPPPVKRLPSERTKESLPNLGIWSNLPKADKLWSKQGEETVICVTKHNVFRFKVAQFVDRKLIWVSLVGKGPELILPIVKRAAKSSWGQQLPRPQRQYSAKCWNPQHAPVDQM